MKVKCYNKLCKHNKDFDCSAEEAELDWMDGLLFCLTFAQSGNAVKRGVVEEREDFTIDSTKGIFICKRCERKFPLFYRYSKEGWRLTVESFAFANMKRHVDACKLKVKR